MFRRGDGLAHHDSHNRGCGVFSGSRFDLKLITIARTLTRSLCYAPLNALVCPPWYLKPTIVRARNPGHARRLSKQNTPGPSRGCGHFSWGALFRGSLLLRRRVRLALLNRIRLLAKLFCYICFAAGTALEGTLRTGADDGNVGLKRARLHL